ncbi:hypothetical protein A7U60_g7857 [Sanghuangporus baumii]|uniref:Uncharacterized protein n=1 Tax=Sanghuangporus baumii TaxID=108892 RepID=A0A9Q5MZL6_SANBA|nr:hypothetical protein A7U60_g7857 [Sanghuangporus baumii]
MLISAVEASRIKASCARHSRCRAVPPFPPFSQLIDRHAAQITGLASHAKEDRKPKILTGEIHRASGNKLEEARAALDLFRSYEDSWEDDIRGGTWPSALPPTAFSQFFT